MPTITWGEVDGSMFGCSFSVISICCVMSVSALIKNGTTVAPGFQRPSGQGELVRLLLILFNVSHNTPSQKGSAKCPSTHPHSLSDGLKCCSKFVRSSSCTEGGPATLKLQFEDSANCCDSADTYDCPASVVAQGRVCTSADISIFLTKNVFGRSLLSKLVLLSR